MMAWLRQRWRFVMVVATGLTLFLAVVIATYDESSTEYLDVNAAHPGGARAIAQILQRSGVEVVPVRVAADVASAVATAGDQGGSASSASAASSVTVVVTAPANVRPDLVKEIAALGTNLVLLAPGPELADWPGPATATTLTSRVAVIAPACELPEATLAGAADMGGVVLTGSTLPCYPNDDGASLTVDIVGDQRVVVAGSADFLTNAHLADEGNAALAMNLLGHSRTLIWYRPVVETVSDEQPVGVLPPWFGPAALMAFFTGLLTVWWRGRRVGPLVHEQLPIVVPASESVRGRGLLYRRIGDRGYSARALRDGTTRRLAIRFGLPPTTSAAAVGQSVADHTHSDPAAVVALLDSQRVPPNDRALVQIAHDLDLLEQEVRLG